MISYSFEHTAGWDAVVEAASKAWPSALGAWTGPPEEASVRGWFGVTPLAGGLPVPSVADRTCAMVVGREPMTPARLSTWMRHVAMRVAVDADLEALTSWRVAERIHRVVLPHDTSAPAGRPVDRARHRCCGRADR